MFISVDQIICKKKKEKKKKEVKARKKEKKNQLRLVLKTYQSIILVLLKLELLTGFSNPFFLFMFSPLQFPLFCSVFFFHFFTFSLKL